MTVDAARYLRQMLLPEIGKGGQARIGMATARVGAPTGDARAPLSHEVAVRYALGAGFGAIEPGSVDIATLAPADVVRAQPAREVLAGARAALAAIRVAIDVQSALRGEELV
jgi:hypothetical protein